MSTREKLQALLNRASEHHSKGELPEALRLFEKADSIKPGWPQLLNAIGTVLLDMGDYNGAEKHFKKAVENSLAYPPALYNLAHIYHSAGARKQAEEYYRKAVDSDPSMVMAWNNLGLILKESGDLEDALSCFQKASEIAPDAAEIWNNLALVLEDLELIPQARSAFHKAVEKDPEHIPALYNLAALELRLEQNDTACRLLEKVLELDPGNESARYLLQGLGRLPAPDAAPVSYIQQVFNDCAENFEDTLVKKLSYQTPKALFRLASPYLKTGMDILDLGCGTGLGADYYRPYAKLLAGMDASPKMLKVAEKKGIYHRLFCADILAPWDLDGLEFHLIYSSDVFVYFGKLDTVLSHINSHLRPEGIVAFSVEQAKTGGEGWRLGKNGRYAHSEDYIYSQLIGSGFKVLAKQATILRKEGSNDVAGMLVVARKC